MAKHALSLEILAECSTSKARVCRMTLPHRAVDTPVFMPVGTQGSMKGVTTQQLEDLNCQIILANTYHLGHRPGPEILTKAGGLHQFMNWRGSLLTDSGGFQMVSLVKLSSVEELGVRFQSPHDGSEMLLSPEKSMEIQGAIGADICMQLDDVVHSCTSGDRLVEATHRSVRWLDRCIAAWPNPERQNLFAIVQGGLNPDLRQQCAQEMTRRDVSGFAVGGLSGGEEKSQFWRMVTLTTDHLPRSKPRYLMGVGVALDLVVCTALGCDMFDCVYPTRTARFGSALAPVPTGILNLKHARFRYDLSPIDSNCRCVACVGGYSRAYFHSMVTWETAAISLLTLHNIAYQLTLMGGMRKAIEEDRFPAFVVEFMRTTYPAEDYPAWAVEALSSVGINTFQTSL